MSQKLRLRKQWDRNAASWAVYAETDLARNLLMQRLLECTAKASPRPNRIIDFGCGEGSFCRLMTTRFPAAEVVGLDMSKAMLDIAIARSENIEYVQHDFEDPLGISFEGKFDLISAMFCLFESFSLEDAFRNASKLLNEGGRMVFAVTDPFTDFLKYKSGVLREARMAVNEDGDLLLISSFSDTHLLGTARYFRLLRPISTYLNCATACGLSKVSVDVFSSSDSYLTGGTSVFFIALEKPARSSVDKKDAD
jgi:SAM-dependent methyltransferase